MDSRRPDEVGPTPEAAAFVRFCYERRRAGWPELYDEMCAVAGRRLYHGWGFTELADRGIGFSLFETPTLALLAREVAREEVEHRLRGATRPPVPVMEATAVETARPKTEAGDRQEPAQSPRLRLAGATVS